MSYGHTAPPGNPPRASFHCVVCGKIASYGGTSWSEPCPGPSDLSKTVNTNMFGSLQLQQMAIFKELMGQRDDLIEAIEAIKRICDQRGDPDSMDISFLADNAIRKAKEE